MFSGLENPGKCNQLAAAWNIANTIRMLRTSKDFQNTNFETIEQPITLLLTWRIGAYVDAVCALPNSNVQRNTVSKIPRN